MQFKEIIGLDNLKEQLIQSYQKGKTAHAQLFLGKAGSAALPMSIAYATYLHCEDKQEHDSCGVCASCQKMKRLVHPDIHFIHPATAAKKSAEETADPFIESWRQFVTDSPYGYISDWSYHAGLENKQLSISSEGTRSVVKRLSLKAFESQFKVVIIWLPEYMNATSANAILKILEEPSDGTVFILVANDIDKILTTIKSRCQLVTIPNFTDEDITAYLTQHYSGIDQDLLSTAVQQAEGNLQEAIIKVTGESTDFLTFFRNWMRQCYTGNYAELVLMGDEFQQMGKMNQAGLLEFGLFILRRSLLSMNSLDQLLGMEAEFVKGFSKTLTSEKLVAITELLNKVAYHLERNANPRITFLNLSIELSTIFNNKN